MKESKFVCIYLQRRYCIQLYPYQNSTHLKHAYFDCIFRLKEFDLGPGKVLLSKVNGQITAVSSKCTHYGAPLITGAYKDGKVRCPWHGACFSTITGDIEDFPGLDSLHKFKVILKLLLIYVFLCI